MLDVATAYKRYTFLGHEFLTWLWYAMDKKRDYLKDSDNNPLSLDIGNRIMLENTSENAKETITIKGDNANLEEGMLALQKGSVVTELNLSLREGDNEWTFNIKGESFSFTGFKTPATGAVEKKEDIEGAVLEKVFLYEKVVETMELLFKTFLTLRLSQEWNKNILPEIKQWISGTEQ